MEGKEIPVYNQRAVIRELQEAVRKYKKGESSAEQEALLWQAVIAFQSCPFKTVSGLPFYYTLKTGKNGEWTRELWINRRENSKSLAWSSVLLAFRNALEMEKTIVSRPKALGDIRGVSYIYPIFWKLGVIEVPEKSAEQMR